jgi:hypothetical protein
MIISTLYLTSALDGRGWLTPRTGRFTPGNDPAPTSQEAGWAPGPVWTVTGSLAPIGIRSRTIQTIASHHTDYVIPVLVEKWWK